MTWQQTLQERLIISHKQANQSGFLQNETTVPNFQNTIWIYFFFNLPLCSYNKLLFCLLQDTSVRGNAVFGRYYAVFQARTPFWKLCPVPWTQFYCGQYSRFEARFSRSQCCNQFCVYERFINSNLIADAQFESPCAAV